MLAMLRIALACSFTLATPWPAVAQVPAAPPTGLPNSILARDNQTPGIGDLLLIAFRADASAEQKDSALSRIDGTVVGGIPLADPDLDGFYIVRVPLTTDLRWAQMVVAQLEYLPWVHVSWSWNPFVAAAVRSVNRESNNPAGDVLEVRIDERWIRNDSDPRLVPFRRRAALIAVDSLLRPPTSPTTVWQMAPSGP